MRWQKKLHNWSSKPKMMYLMRGKVSTDLEIRHNMFYCLAQTIRHFSVGYSSSCCLIYIELLGGCWIVPTGSFFLIPSISLVTFYSIISKSYYTKNMDLDCCLLTLACFPNFRSIFNYSSRLEKELFWSCCVY